MTDWKKMSKRLSDIHGERGFAAVDKSGEDIYEYPFPFINTSPESGILTLAGKEVSAKRIRRFTWENRNKRQVTRDRGIVWTYYDVESDTSYLGTGAVVNPRVLGKIGEDSILRGIEKEEING